MSFKSPRVIRAILIVRHKLPEYYWYFFFVNTQKTPDIKGFVRKIRCDGTGRHPFILIEKDQHRSDVHCQIYQGRAGPIHSAASSRAHLLQPGIYGPSSVY